MSRDCVLNMVVSRWVMTDCCFICGLASETGFEVLMRYFFFVTGCVEMGFGRGSQKS